MTSRLHAFGPTSATSGLSAPSQPRVCFVAPRSYGLLSQRKDLPQIGGAERQQVILARELHCRGYPVSFITLDHGQPDGARHDGILVYKTCAPDAGVPVLRFVYPRWTSLWSAMARANADTYYYRGADCEAGQVALWCRHHRRRFIFAVASDADCVPELPLLFSRRERGLYLWGLRRADAIIAQTAAQQRMLRESFGLSSTVVPNCCPWPQEAFGPMTRPDRSGPPRVLWVGRVSPEKRPDWLLEVAARCPKFTFDVVGAANTASEYAEGVGRRAAGMANVVMHGRIPHAQMSQFYRTARVLCCTSVHEGFPNTFLEAWSRRLPVVTTFDPDGVVAAHGIGRVAETVDQLAGHLRDLLASSALWQEASRAAWSYYLENHTPEVSLARLEQVINEVVG